MSDVYGLYVGGGTIDDKLYVAKLDDKNNTFSPSTLTGTPTSGLGIRSMAVYNGELYIGGFTVTPYLAKLDNNTNTFGTNLIDKNVPFNYVYAMTVYNKKLYLGGDGVVAVYDGNNFSHDFTYPDINGNSVNSIQVMTLYNDSLYIGGTYTSKDDDGTYNLYVAKLDNDNKKFTSITFTGTPTSGNYSFTGILSMAVYKKTLYIGGTIQDKKDKNLTITPYLAKLDNTFGKNLITDKNVPFTYIYAMIQYKDTLYLGGGTGVVPYDGKNFSPVEDVSSINSMTIYNGELYASGDGPLPLPSIRVIKLDTNNKWISNDNGLPVEEDNFSISSMIDYHPDVLHADTSGLRIYKKSKNLALILGLSIGLGIPVLGVIIFLMYKYIPRTNQQLSN